MVDTSESPDMLDFGDKESLLPLIRAVNHLNGFQPSVENIHQYLLSYNFSMNDTRFLDTEFPNFSQFPIGSRNVTLSYHVPTRMVVLLSIFYGSISMIAVVGNALVMWIVASSRNMHSVTNYFIANLALADIIIGLFSIPFQFQAALLQRWNLPYFMCALCPFLQTVSVNVSVFTLTAIAVDRYRAIVHPLNARPSKFRSKVAIFFIWVFSVVLAVPNAIALRVQIIEDEVFGGLKPVCGPINIDPVFLQTYMHLLVGVQYFLPLCIISFAYIRIGWELWGAQTPGNAEDGRDAHVLKNKKKVIKMLFVVVAIFAICWAPLQTYYIVQELHPSINEMKYINYIWFASHWLAMSNSCCNPFIYAIYNGIGPTKRPSIPVSPTNKEKAPTDRHGNQTGSLEKFKREFRYKLRFLFRQGTTTSDMERSRNQASFRLHGTTPLPSANNNPDCNKSYLNCEPVKTDGNSQSTRMTAISAVSFTDTKYSHLSLGPRGSRGPPPTSNGANHLHLKEIGQDRTPSREAVNDTSI